MAELVYEKWDEILENLKNNYGVKPVSFTTWISPLKISRIEGSDIYLTSDSEQIVINFNFIKTKYSGFIKTSIGEITNIEYNILFEAGGSASKAKSRETKVSIANSLGNPLHPDYTFDNFVVSNSNALAHATALKVAEAPGEYYNPLYIYGNSGLGKTHLMNAIGHFILENNPDKKVMYVTSENFTNELIESLRSGNITPAAFRDKYRNVDVLLIDDIQFIIGKQATQEEFFNTFNSLYETKKQIVITSDRPPREFTTLDERWRTRFGWGLIVDITSPDYETKIAILKKKIEIKSNEGNDVDIDNEALSYMAENINTSIRELEGALTKVIAMSKITRSPATKELAEYALRDICTPNKKKIITPDFIIEVVAENFNFSTADILSKRRDKPLAAARQVAMYLSNKYTDYSVTEISKIFEKDHSTVIHNVAKIENDIKNDKELADAVQVLINKINPDKS